MARTMARWLRAGRRADDAPPEPNEAERQIMRSLARLGDTTVREVMTPRVDVIALRAPVRVADVLRAVRETGHSRFPVYEEDDLDHLVGVLFVKDLVRSGWDRDDELVRRMRKPLAVPESRPVLALLQEMRQGHIAFAVVLDEHGGVEGVLTVKDLVGALVGELPDEFDEDEEDEISRVDGSRWLVDGACPVERLRLELGAALPEGEYVSLGGFLFDAFGRIPSEGDRVEREGWEFRVEAMDRRRIAKVVVRAPSGTIAGSGPPDNGK